MVTSQLISICDSASTIWDVGDGKFMLVASLWCWGQVLMFKDAGDKNSNIRHQYPKTVTTVLSPTFVIEMKAFDENNCIEQCLITNNIEICNILYVTYYM